MKSLILLLLVFSVSAYGQDSYPRGVTLCWDHPLLYVDGTDIQPGDLADTRLTIDRHDGTRAVDTLVAVVGLPGDSQCATLAAVIPKPGTYTAFAYAITIDGTSSDASNASVKRYTGKPLSPKNLKTS